MAGRLRVITQPGDVHAGAVAWALADRNIETKWMCLTDFPAAEKYSFSLDDFGDQDQERDALPDMSCDYVWIRRVGRSPGVPLELDERDKVLCQRESERFFHGLLYSLAPKAWWINPLNSYLMSRSNKLHQLRVAKACGLSIPPTLASNNPEHIRDFCRAQSTNVIAKPFFPHMWNSLSGGSHEYLTSLVSAKDLTDSRALQASPLIYQGFIEKSFEVRAVFFGGAVIAAKLDAKGDSDLHVDWRHPSKNPVVEPFNLPSRIRESCMRVMKALGLVHGSFDFVVRPDGEFFFLEVNESGQCLWLEHDCQDLPVLSALVGLILQRSEDFCDSDIAKYSFRFSDFMSSPAYAHFLDDAETNHLPISREGIVFME